MAITRVYQFDWVELQYQVLEGKIGVTVKHEDMTTHITVADWISEPELLHKVMHLKNGLVRASRVAAALMR